MSPLLSAQPLPAWPTNLLVTAGSAAEPVLLKPPIAAAGVPLPLMMVIIGGIFLGTLAISRFSLKIGVPAILGVLLFGLFINPSVTMFSHDTILRLQTLSLSILLFNAGLETDTRSIRGFLEYGILLAVGGVIVSSLVLGGFVWFVASPDAGGFELGFGQIPVAVAMLIAACLGSTDAGATINVLESVRNAIPRQLAALVKFESAVNDPTGILFLGLVIGLTTVGHGDNGQEVVLEEIQTFLQKIGSGLLIGLVVSYLGRFSLNRLVREASQLLILGISAGLIAYGLRESLLVSWCGLRGAVPLALSFVMVEAIPRVRGIDPAIVPSLVRNAGGIVFCVVVIDLLVQGFTLPLMARWLGLEQEPHLSAP